MKGPTICRLPCGSARRTSNPSPRSRVRGTMTRSSASHDFASPSTGSLEGCQLMGGLLWFCGDHTSIGGVASKDGTSLYVVPVNARMTHVLRIRNPMIAPLKPGITLAQPNGPVIETERLLLRQWRGDDVAPNTAMLADPGTARFITIDGKPVTSELNGWRNAAIMAGHWVLHGVGMFVVEEKSSGKFVGRAGPCFPPGWPSFHTTLSFSTAIPT